MKAMLLKTSQTQDCTLYSKTPDTERFMKTTDEIRARLFELQDLKYKEFNSKLIPTVPPERFIGVRIPDLRKLAKETAKETNKKKPVSSKSDSRKTSKVTKSSQNRKAQNLRSVIQWERKTPCNSLTTCLTITMRKMLCTDIL